MALIDAPVVRLGDLTLASRWSTRARIALAGLRITWGRKSHLEPAKASQLYLEVLDTDGHLTSAVHLTGQPITVTRADGRIIFRGRVDDHEVEYKTVHDPDANAPRRAWLIKLTAASKLAQLGQSFFKGPNNDNVEYFGPNFWPMSPAAGRVLTIMEAGADRIVDAIEWTDPYPTDNGQGWAMPRRESDQLSALDLIEGLYAAVPLGFAEYRPADDRIICGTPTRTSGLALRYNPGGNLYIDFKSGTPGRSIPARTIGVPNGYVATTGINDAIDVVKVTGRLDPITANGEDAAYVMSAETPQYNLDAGGRREHHLEPDIILIGGAAPNIGAFQWPFPLSTVSAEYGPRPGIGDGFHDGIDFSGGDAHEGAIVTSIGPGVYDGKLSHPDYGNTVIIDHGLDVNGDRLRSIYCHLQADPGWTAGKTFTKGAPVGLLGNTGLSTGPHLHLETQVNGTSIDPRIFMADRQYGDQPEWEINDGWHQWLADDTAELLGQLNHKLTLPTARFDFRRFTYPAGVTDFVLETYTRPDQAVYFPGSVFNVALDSAAAHQLIGGTLVYHEGWTHDVTLAPAISTAGAGLTLDQLCLDPRPTLADFQRDITLADLGNVSEGVPAP